MIYERYVGKIVQISLNQTAFQGLDYVGRVVEADSDFIRLGYHSRYNNDRQLEHIIKEIKELESGIKKYKVDFSSEVSLNKLVIAGIKPLE